MGERGDHDGREEQGAEVGRRSPAPLGVWLETLQRIAHLPLSELKEVDIQIDLRGGYERGEGGEGTRSRQKGLWLSIVEK
jgi:hypothetical protein